MFKSFIYFLEQLVISDMSHFFGDLFYRVANMALSAPMISVDLVFFFMAATFTYLEKYSKATCIR